MVDDRFDLRDEEDPDEAEDSTEESADEDDDTDEEEEESDEEESDEESEEESAEEEEESEEEPDDEEDEEEEEEEEPADEEEAEPEEEETPRVLETLDRASDGANEAAGAGNVGDPVEPCHADHSLIGFPNPFARKRKKITLVKVVHVTFKTDHGRLKDNNSTWENTGTLFAKPEWDYGKPSKPISQTKNTKVTVEVEFDVYPRDADPTACKIIGTAAFGSLVFRGSGQISGGFKTYTASTDGALPDEVDKLTGDIAWSVDTTDDGVFDAEKSWGHTIYVTIDTPMGDTATVGFFEEGITQKRMDKAVALVKGTGLAKPPWADRPHQIVQNLMGLIGDYVLVPDPAVPAALKHPTYFSGTTGGAWNIADFIAQSAECQAIVRFIRAIIKQVGCPGTTQVMVIYADPTVNNGNTVLEDDNEHPPAGGSGLHHTPMRSVNGRNSFASLVDAYPGDAPGTIFDGNRRGRLPGIGSNAFEATLKFTHAGTSKYYPGGTGGGPGLATKEDVIKAFQALVWLSSPPGGRPSEDLVRVEQIVKRYRDKSGNVIP